MAVFIPIISEFNSKGIDQAKREFASLEGAGKKAQFAIKKAAVPAIAALGAIGGAATVAAKEAVDYGETLNAVFVTFGEKGSKEIGKLADASAKTYGLSKTDFNNMAVSFSNFANDLATPQKKASSIVKDLSGRVADFASVMNISVPDAAAKMASALAGEAEPMKKFGINISNAAVETYALENNIGKAGEKLTESDKAVARYGLLMQKTSVYSGDFANTSDSLANKQKILGAEFDNLKISIGEKLIPVFEVMMDLVKGFSDWASQNKDIVTIIGIAIGGIAAAIVLVNAALAVSPIGWIIIGVGLLGAALVIAYKKFEPFRDIVDTVFGAMKFWITKVTIPALETLLTVFKTVFNGIASIWNNTIGKLSFKLPGWLPGDLGGAGFSMPKIPMLADGGIVSSATLAVIGEKGPEAVIPLDKMGQMGGGNNVTINVHGGDPNAVVAALRTYMRQNGSVPIKVSNIY